MLPWQPHSLLSLSFYLHNLILLECTLYLVCLFTISPWKLGTLSHRGRCVSPMPPPWLWYCIMLIFFGGSEVKVSAWNVGDLGSIPGLGRSPGEGNGNPLQYSCLENPMEGGAWWAIVHGVTKSWTPLSDFTFIFFLFFFLASFLRLR